MADNEDLLDYEDEEQPDQAVVDGSGDATALKKEVKGAYVSIHSSGFRDFLLKPEILRAIVDCGFEHPSEGTYRPDSGLNRFIYCYLVLSFTYNNFIPSIAFYSQIVLYSSNNCNI